MLARNEDTMELFNRLYKRAVHRFRCSHDLAEDAASHAICSGLAAGNLNYGYLATAVRNFLYAYWRDRATRNENYALPVNEEGEPMEPMMSATRPCQHIRIEAMECALAIESLPARVRPTMRLVAQDYTADEIANALELPKSEIVWQTKYGRKILRQRDGYEIERKRGHHQFIGIRRKHRVWEATFRAGNNDIYLGHFKTAAEAAKAYDDKARELLGDAAKLNFPDTPATMD